MAVSLRLVWAGTEVMPWELDKKMGQTGRQEAIKVKEAGTEEWLWLSRSLEWQLYCIFIQPVKCSLNSADSRTGP